MTRSLYPLLPDAQALLALAPEELAGVVLEFLIEWERSQPISRHNFSLYHTAEGFPEHLKDQVQRALMEAWAWIEREGLVAPMPNMTSEGWYFVTRRGHELKTRAGVEAYRMANRLPRETLHPTIATKVWAPFLRGDYDTAVFQAFKEVEVAVRRAGKFGPNDIGVSLMRSAFRPPSGASPLGPLADASAPTGEQLAVMELFAGAIGHAKNPHSHRNVALSDPAEAVELIGLANYLLRLVDARAPAPP